MRFEEYIPYNGPEGEGFILVQNSEYEEVYIFDDYGGWVDTDLNYYDHQGDPAGYFDTDHNFFDMKGVRIPGGYRGTKSTDKRIAEIHRYVEKVQGNDKAKFGTNPIRQFPSHRILKPASQLQTRPAGAVHHGTL
jgi:hypothetical protein